MVHNVYNLVGSVIKNFYEQIKKWFTISGFTDAGNRKTDMYK